MSDLIHLEDDFFGAALDEAWDLFHPQTYWRMEERLTAFLQSKGFTEIRWISTESDSFGPLSREVRATFSGARYFWYYG